MFFIYYITLLFHKFFQKYILFNISKDKTLKYVWIKKKTTCTIHIIRS